MKKDSLELEQGVLLDLHSLDKQDLDLSPLLTALPHWRIYHHTPPEAVVPRLREAQVAVINKVVLDQDTLARAPRLRLVCVTATGTDNVDVAAAQRLGITVCNARNYATDSVLQHWLMLLLALVRRLDDHRRAIRTGAWSASAHFALLDHPFHSLCGLTLGIVGHGVLGRAVADLARRLGMEVVVAERPDAARVRPGRVPWAEFLPRVDVLSLHCPLTPATHHLVDGHALAQMRPGAWLINTARGALVDSRALAEALRAGRLAGAALDVLDVEPPSPEHPLLAPDLPGLILTPHVAWAAVEARQRLVEQVGEVIRAYRNGRPINEVAPP